MCTPRTHGRSDLRRLAFGLAVLGLAGCGGGSPTIGGTLAGLASGQSITIQNNGIDTLTLSTNGAWAFPQAATAGTYSVTILTQPSGQTCTLANATGTYVAGASSVTSIQIDCGSSTAISGTVSGLLSGNTVALSDGSQTITVTANGSFTFGNTLAAGTAYTVSVVTQPTEGTCAVSNASGIIVADVETNVVVTCN